MSGKWKFTFIIVTLLIGTFVVLHGCGKKEDEQTYSTISGANS